MFVCATVYSFVHRLHAPFFFLCTDHMLLDFCVRTLLIVCAYYIYIYIFYFSCCACYTIVLVILCCYTIVRVMTNIDVHCCLPSKPCLSKAACEAYVLKQRMSLNRLSAARCAKNKTGGENRLGMQ
jgi:hypothetical protein